MTSVNPSYKIMCCLGCGRDTKSIIGYCGKCYVNKKGGSHTSDRKGRSCLSTARQYGADGCLDGSVDDNKIDKKV